MSKKLLIGYLPRGSSGWILEFLFHDLARSSIAKDIEYIFCYDVISIYKLIFLRKRWKILCMHPSVVKGLRRFGIPSRNISAHCTHTRLGVRLSIDSLSKLHALFPINSCEANILINDGIPSSKVHVLNIGYSSSLFSWAPTPKEIPERCIDVLFVGRYYTSSAYYAQRKNYDLVVKTVSQLLARSPDLRICFLGEGWNRCEGLRDLDVEYVECTHADYPGVYRKSKLYVNLSRQEGGPISWIEAFACGCYVLSTPSGFALELESSKLFSWVAPFSLNSIEWSEKIFQLSTSFSPLDADSMAQRRKFLERFDFKYLATSIEQILFE